MTTRPNLTTAAALLLIFAAFFWAQADDARTAAAQEEAEALASRDWAASQVCKGQPFTWEDDKTLVCYREVHP